jgi:MoaA/NifB/PqqE/SkfB family radical SAM enzyme
LSKNKKGPYPSHYDGLKLNKIFRNTDYPSHFTVDWMLHDKCTYDCSYCPPANKSGTDGLLNLEKLDEFCNQLEKHVYGIDPTFKIHILFTGGEPTVWKDFGTLVSRLAERGWLLSVNSNASRSERWWEEHAKNFVNVIFSYHTEGVNDDEFIRKLQICEKYAKTSINVMLNTHPEYFEKAVNFSNRILAETTCVDFTHYKIQHNFGLQTINVPLYTKEQKEIISTLKDHYYDSKRKHPVLEDNLYVAAEDGTVSRLNAVALLNTNKANFFDWNCHAGREGIFIDAKGNIQRGACRVGGTFGNINDPANIAWPDGPVRCPKTWCGCVTDIMSSKEK